MPLATSLAGHSIHPTLGLVMTGGIGAMVMSTVDGVGFRRLASLPVSSLQFHCQVSAPSATLYTLIILLITRLPSTWTPL